MKYVTLLLPVLLMLGCRGAPLSGPSFDVDAHIEDATAARLETGASDPTMAALEAKVLELAKAWEVQLATPSRLQASVAFDTPAMAALRKQAVAPEFPSMLSGPLSEELLLAAAFERNPMIRAARLKLRGTVEQYAQVTYLDNILRQYASFQRGSRTKVGMPLPGDRLEKQYPFPGTLELKAAVVEQSIQEAQARYAGVVRDVVVKARTAHATTVYLDAAIRLSSAMLSYLDQLEEAARSMLAAGKARKGAVLQTQVERSALGNELVTLKHKHEISKARMATLIDVPLSTPLGEATSAALPPFPAELAALTARALEAQPDLAVVRARLQRMQVMIELAERMAYPVPSAGLSEMAGLSHATGGSDKEREPFTTRPKIKPQPFFGTSEAYLRESREGVRAMQARLEGLENSTRLSVKDAHVDLETAKRLHELYRDLQLAQAEQAYRDAASGYAAGRVVFLNVVDTLRRWLRFQLDDERAQRDYRIAHARLEGVVGEALSGAK